MQDITGTIYRSILGFELAIETDQVFAFFYILVKMILVIIGLSQEKTVCAIMALNSLLNSK